MTIEEKLDKILEEVVTLTEQQEAITAQLEELIEKMNDVTIKYEYERNFD